MALTPATVPLAAMLPNTEYFEVDSDHVGSRFGIWVTTPPQYAAEAGRRYPAIYMPDGNGAAPGFAPRTILLRDDPIQPIEPFIQVAVGYCGDEAADSLKARNRDLLPPGEPVDPRMEAQIAAFVERGFFTPESAAAYKVSLYDGHADRFLAFLVEELHPALADRYRIDAASSGLFGYSYGGLFAAWAALQKPALFTRIGAGSPGLMTRESQVFRLLDRAIADGSDFTGRSLHMTVCEREITAPSFYQALGESFARFTATIGRAPLKGLAFSARIVPDETHATGSTAAWASFLRTCYSAR